MQRLFSILFFFIIVPIITYGQSSKLDSLILELEGTQHDSIKYFFYNAIAGELYLRDMERYDEFISDALALATKNKDKRWIARFTYTNAISLAMTDVEKGIEQYLIALDLYTELKDTGRMAVIHTGLVSRYSDIGNTDRAIAHFEIAKSLISEEEVGKTASLNNRIGALYGTNGDWATALRYYRQNIPLFEKIGHNNGLGFTHQNVGIGMEELGLLDSALYHMELGLKYQRTTKLTRSIASNLTTLGEYYMNRGTLNEAERYFLEAIDLTKESNTLFYLSYLYESLTRVYDGMGDQDRAISYGLLTLEAARKGNDIHTEKDVLGLLSAFYEESNDYRNALLYKKEELNIKDSIAIKSSKNAIEELEVKYQTAEKESQIKLKESEISRQQVINGGLVAVAGLLSALFIMVWRNLQQRKRVQIEMQKLDQVKSQFFSNISHELRTPITLIKGPLENALTKISERSTIRRDLKIAHQSSGQLLGLVNEILALTKLENGEMSIDEIEVDLRRLTGRIFSAFESLAAINKIQLIYNFNIEGYPIVLLDVAKTEKILNNLLSNAIKFTPQLGKVSMSVDLNSNQMLSLSIQDSGTGITEKDKERIFDRFYQGQDKSKHQGGTGIGLALSRELARLMKGDITVVSESTVGSSFITTLPYKLIRVDNNSPVETIIESTIQYEPTVLYDDQPNVLVIEDNQLMRQYLDEVLSPYFKLSFAVDGQDGLNKVEIKEYDAITCDVMMPHMDGFEFLAALRARELKRRTPVIMLTARSLEEDKLAAFQLGSDDYLTKPFGKTELYARLHALITNHRVRLSDKDLQSGEEEIAVTADEKWLRTAEENVLEHIDRETYNGDELALAMSYSRRQLNRLLKKNTGLTANQFIKEIRLRKAYQMLQAKKYATISEVRYEVGMTHASYFTKEFEKRWGLRPSEVG